MVIQTISDIKKDVQKRTVVKSLVKTSKTNIGFYLLLSIAALITSLGLTLNSEATVIGGMLMAPLLRPILALGLGIATLSPKAIFRSLLGIVNSMVLVLFISIITSIILHEGNYVTEQILMRNSYSDLYLLIAILSGIGATYTLMDPNLESSLPGVAVSVSLVPPLCVTGIAFAQSNSELLSNSFKIFSVNLIGIILSSILVFLIFRFAKFKKQEEQVIIKEENISI